MVIESFFSKLLFSRSMFEELSRCGNASACEKFARCTELWICCHLQRKFCSGRWVASHLSLPNFRLRGDVEDVGLRKLRTECMVAKFCNSRKRDYTRWVCHINALRCYLDQRSHESVQPKQNMPQRW
ncbi:uncharacterized protein [Physcomitrium patens]|uniref:Uncharacterized protein n=1 Tax=Physcomitrium patens TaxID=3218 RepID=A0A7I4B6M1_PHYPA|nr:uncharacterized protein LOC112294077 [Physcomitrium patens]|eukprot:XP_024399981.1 uncharacterized protein LOC112294077 [Physcomitrella patens]